MCFWKVEHDKFVYKTVVIATELETWRHKALAMSARLQIHRHEPDNVLKYQIDKIIIGQALFLPLWGVGEMRFFL